MAVRNKTDFAQQQSPLGTAVLSDFSAVAESRP